MEGDGTEGATPGVLSDDYVKQAVQFVVHAHAATVNMRLYPASSSMVTETLEKSKEWLDQLLEVAPTFSVSVIESSLIINDVRLEELEQSRAPIKSFVAWMSERGLANMEFTRGVTNEELKTVFEFTGEMMDSAELRAEVPAELKKRGVEHISLNQRVYVAIAAGEDASEAAAAAIAGAAGTGGGGGGGGPLDALKDELLIRYLMGKIDLGEVEDTEVGEVLSDTRKVGGLMSRFLAEEGSEGGVLVRSEKAEDALDRLAQMIGDIEDESLRDALSEQVTSVVAEMDPRQMTSVLTGRAPANLDVAHVRQNVIKMLSDEQLMDIVDSLIDEYGDMKTEVGELDESWTRDHLKNLNAVLMEVRNGARGDVLSEQIDRKLEEAGIEEEREPSTGKRVLSAEQMLGGPLDEEDLPDLGEGVDRTIPKQIGKLYSMGEKDLAAGMLLKLTGNLKNDSERVRRYASLLAKEVIEELPDEHRILAADVLLSSLMAGVEGERDFKTFENETDTLAVVAEVYVKSGRADDGARVLELLSSQSSGEADKGAELAKHASQLVESVVQEERLVDAQEILAEADDEKRRATVRAVASLGPAALQPIVDAVKDRGQVELRDRAIEAFKAAGPTGEVALLAELKKQNPWYIYRNVLNVLADMKAVDAAPEISEMAAHPDERIRREVIRTLARIGSHDSLQVVRDATLDSSTAVRRTAVRVLGMFGDSSVAPYLIEMINGEGPMGKEEDQGVEEAACLALGELRNPAYVPNLVELLGKGGLFKKGRPDEIRAAACIALGMIGDPSALPALQKAARDNSVMVRSGAEKAIRRLQEVPATPQPVAPAQPPQAARPPAQAWDSVPQQYAGQQPPADPPTGAQDAFPSAGPPAGAPGESGEPAPPSSWE